MACRISLWRVGAARPLDEAGTSQGGSMRAVLSNLRLSGRRGCQARICCFGNTFGGDLISNQANPNKPLSYLLVAKANSEFGRKSEAIAALKGALSKRPSKRGGPVKKALLDLEGRGL